MRDHTQRREAGAAAGAGNALGGSVREVLTHQRGGPTVRRIILGAQLRRLREAAGLTAEQASRAIRASEAKISRLERGRVGCKERDIVDLLNLYGVRAGEEQAVFLNLARSANTLGWWHSYGDVTPRWMEALLALEEAAQDITCYQSHSVPGLLQTPSYARALAHARRPGATATEVDRHVELRQRRQRVLSQQRAPALSVLLDESVLLRPIGSRQSMRGQLERLLDACDDPGIRLLITPLRAGTPAGACGPFMLLRFSETDLPDVVYVEQLTSALYVDKADEVGQYADLLASMSRLALGSVDSRQMIDRYLSSM